MRFGYGQRGLSGECGGHRFPKIWPVPRRSLLHPLRWRRVFWTQWMCLVVESKPNWKRSKQAETLWRKVTLRLYRSLVSFDVCVVIIILRQPYEPRSQRLGVHVELSDCDCGCSPDHNDVIGGIGWQSGQLACYFCDVLWEICNVFTVASWMALYFINCKNWVESCISVSFTGLRTGNVFGMSSESMQMAELWTCIAVKFWFCARSMITILWFRDTTQ